MNNKYKHLFFDMDGTLTRSRSSAAPEMIKVFNSLDYDTIVISGAEIKQINSQVGDLNLDYRMGQNGNQAYDKKGEIWNNVLSDAERKEIMEHINHLERIRDWDVKNANDLIEDRGSQISYSCLGHHEEIEKKEQFDPGGDIRNKLLEENTIPLTLVDVKVGGTTCFDYFKKDSNKGTNILKLIKEKGWDIKECLYFGDALFPGGNDETMLGIMDVQKVENEEETLKILAEHYANS